MKDKEQVAKAVRDACIQAALEAYEDAGMSGLCAEGRWECAISAMRRVRLDAVIQEALAPEPPEKH